MRLSSDDDVEPPVEWHKVTGATTLSKGKYAKVFGVVFTGNGILDTVSIMDPGAGRC